MRRWETLAALAAVILANLAALPIPGRLIAALVAVVLILVVGIVQVRRLLTHRRILPAFDPAERARQIREQRARDRDA